MKINVSYIKYIIYAIGYILVTEFPKILMIKELFSKWSAKELTTRKNKNVVYLLWIQQWNAQHKTSIIQIASYLYSQ